jgi:TRAP transporter TAXI family solute receptor
VRASLIRSWQRILAISWRDLFLVLLPVLVVLGTLGWFAVKLIRPAPPSSITILGGPENSGFNSTAQRFAKIVASHGIKVSVITTDGSEDNLRRLRDKKNKADVGLAQAGIMAAADAPELRSLGTLYAQPLLVFYRGTQAVDRVTAFKGKKIAVGPEGSGVYSLAMKVLKENGITAENSTLLSLEGDDAIESLREKKVDVIFIMTELIRGQKIRDLVRSPDLQLMHFSQADGYLRRLRFLSKLTVPQGSFDLATNIPNKDILLIGAPVQLVAREDLHPAISDILIAAAKEIYNPPGIFRRAGEFPSTQEYDFPISDDAKRYYASGSPFLYKRLPFWLASLADRILIILVPLLIVIVPLSRIAAPLYRWRIRSKIYRWYGALMAIERDMRLEQTAQRRSDISHRFMEIEKAVNQLRLPLAFADQIYVLREHIHQVRDRFEHAAIRSQED